MTMSEMCNNNKNLPLKFSVYSYINSAGEHPLYGSVISSMKEIEAADKKSLKLKNKKGGPAGFIRFN